MSPVNIRKSDPTSEVACSAPAKQKEDYNIESDNDMLTIYSDLNADNTAEERRFRRSEFFFSLFLRAFSHPETVDLENIKPCYENGILKSKLPKRMEFLPNPKELFRFYKKKSILEGTFFNLELYNFHLSLKNEVNCCHS